MTDSTIFPAMGSDVELQLIDADPAAAVGSALVADLFARHERALSRFLPDSELCALNAAAGTPFLASPLLFEAVSDAVGWACVTDGVFDPTILDVLVATGYDRTFDQIPPRSAAVAELPRTKTRQWRDIAFDFERNMITLPAGVGVDLGGIGKGFTVDRAIAALGPGINAMVNASGDLFAAGDGPDGDGWYVGIQDPFEPARDFATLNVNDRAVATSGSARRNWTAMDARYHHLIDPREGRSSSSDLITMTVVATTTTQADALAKTAYLLGSAGGVRFIERFPAAECVGVTLAGDVVTSTGIEEFYA